MGPACSFCSGACGQGYLPLRSWMWEMRGWPTACFIMSAEDEILFSSFLVRTKWGVHQRHLEHFVCAIVSLELESGCWALQDILPSLPKPAMGVPSLFLCSASAIFCCMAQGVVLYEHSWETAYFVNNFSRISLYSFFCSMSKLCFCYITFSPLKWKKLYLIGNT